MADANIEHRLKPLRKRLWSALAFAWEIWIPPWDRRAYGPWDGLKMPAVAWRVSWDVHRNAKESVRPEARK